MKKFGAKGDGKIEDKGEMKKLAAKPQAAPSIAAPQAKDKTKKG